MATNIGLLPLLKIVDSVGIDEDWVLPILFSMADQTPIDLTGIVFVATISNSRRVPFFSVAGALFGTAHNLLVFTVTAAQKAGWGAGNYALSILATDPSAAPLLTVDLLGNSLLKVGYPRSTSLVQLLPPGVQPTTAISPIQPGLMAFLQGTAGATAGVMAVNLAALSKSQRAALRQALAASLPNVQLGDAIPAAGQEFINASGFVVIAQ